MKYILGILIILFATYADIFLFRIGIVPLEPALFLIPLFIVVSVIKYPVIDYLSVFKSHSFKLLAFVLFMSMIYSAFSNASSEVIIQKISLNLITLLLYLYIVHFFRTENKQLVVAVAVIGTFVLGGSILYDFFYGLPKHNIDLAMSVRKGGFGENPNQAASGVKFLALASLVYLTKSKTLKYIVIAFMCLTVFMTFSRSGLVSIILILAFGALNNWNFNFQQEISVLFQRFFKLFLLFAILYVSLIALADVIRENFPEFTRGEAGERLDLLTGKSKSRNMHQGAIEGGRAELLIDYIDKFVKNPLGYGTGYSSDKRVNGGMLNTHNYYIYLAVNLSFLTLVAFLVYVYYNFKLAFQYNQFYYFLFAVMFFLEGFFTHNLFYERSVLVCVAFFDSCIYKKSA
ncbi:O-antigen ligase family protein [Winogradskyella sp. A2]|uniref:O-antigen ligase family protein n=1 Tax=Winogradskyella sp. A2 TaxID=3366944 RepID=UPI00398C4061